MTSTEYPAPLASIQHRLGGRAVDVALSIVTLNIGWLIWSLVLWGQGQTPGKQLLKLRVYDKTTGMTVKWGHMAIREFGLPLAGIIVILILVAIWIFFPLLTVYVSEIPLYIIFILLILITVTSFAIVYIVDPLWIFRRGKRNRLTDIILKTDVLNESPDPR